MDLHPRVVMTLISVIYLLLGMMLDAYGMLILTIPFVFPVILNLGFDPVWFGIYAVLMCEIALITPPVGINVYVMAKVQPDVPLTTIFRGIVPFFFTTLLVVILLTLFPEIVMWLPNQAFARRSEEHTSELQSLMRISYAVFC